MKHVKNMSTKDFNYIKSLRDCPVEVSMKIDGVPITIDFTDGVFRIRTKRSGWIYIGTQFIEHAIKTKNANIERAIYYSNMFDYLKMLQPLLYDIWEQQKLPITYEVLFNNMMMKIDDSYVMVKNKFPQQMFDKFPMILFDHERAVDPLNIYGFLSVLPCYKGIIEISRSIDNITTKQELHDYLKNLAVKLFPVDEFELEGYVFYFPGLENRYKVFM